LVGGITHFCAAGAQTERRGDAGPVRGLLGGKDRAGRFYFQRLEIRSQVRWFRTRDVKPLIYL
jgi:hypothetical protein